MSGKIICLFLGTKDPHPRSTPKLFHTYHIGEYGVWVHNAECCDVIQGNAGSKRQWDTNLNKQTLNPNTRHEVNNGIHKHIYHTDGQGRVNKGGRSIIFR